MAGNGGGLLDDGHIQASGRAFPFGGFASGNQAAHFKRCGTCESSADHDLNMFHLSGIELGRAILKRLPQPA
jgi:hypothetical protein